MSDAYEDDFEEEIRSPTVIQTVMGSTEAAQPVAQKETQVAASLDPQDHTLSTDSSGKSPTRMPEKLRLSDTEEVDTATAPVLMEPAAANKTRESGAQTEDVASSFAEVEYTVSIGGALYTVPSSRPVSSRPCSKRQSTGIGGRVSNSDNRPSSRCVGAQLSQAHVSNELRKIDLLMQRPKTISNTRSTTDLKSAHKGSNAGAKMDAAHGVDVHGRVDEAEVEKSNESIESASGRSICNAACAGDAAMLTKLISQRSTLTGVSAASAASAASYVTINGTQYGIKRNGQKYTIGLGGKATPLQFAAAMGHAGVVKCLLDMGVIDESSGALPSAAGLAEANCFSAAHMLLKLAVKKKRFSRRPTIKPTAGSKPSELGNKEKVPTNDVAPDQSRVAAEAEEAEEAKPIDISQVGRGREEESILGVIPEGFVAVSIPMCESAPENMPTSSESKPEPEGNRDVCKNVPLDATAKAADASSSASFESDSD